MLVLEGHADVTSLVYAPDGRMLVSGGRDGAVCLWDPFAGRLLRTCRTNGLAATISSVAISSSGGLVAAGMSSGEACTWFVGDGALYRRYRLCEGRSTSQPAFVVFSPDGQRLITACHDEAAEWRLAGEERIRTMSRAPYWSLPSFTSLALVANGEVALGYFNGVQYWLHSSTKSAAGLNWPSGDVVSLDYSAPRQLLAVARGRSVGLWGPHKQDSSRLRCTRDFRHEEQVRACAFTADSRLLLSAGDDWNVHLWDVDSGEKRGSFNWRLGPVVALAVAPDGMTAAVAGRDRPGILIFDLE